MFLSLLEREHDDPVVLATRCATRPISTSWMVQAPSVALDAHRTEIAPGIFLIKIKQWLPTSALDIAEQLPYDYDVEPIKRVYPFPQWHDDAGCRGTDDAVFFGEQAVRPPFSRGALRRARTICRTCPVARTCLTHALTQPEEYGVWAGTSGGQRFRLAERIEHGEPLEGLVDECLAKLSQSARPRRPASAPRRRRPPRSSPPAIPLPLTVPA